MRRPRRPSAREYVETLELIRVRARVLADTFQATGAADHFRWAGGMNDVEALRDALDAYDLMRWNSDDGDDDKEAEP